MKHLSKSPENFSKILTKFKKTFCYSLIWKENNVAKFKIKKNIKKKNPRLRYRYADLRILNIKVGNKFLIVVNILSQLVELINLIDNSLL